MEVSKKKLEDIRKAASVWLQRNLDYELVQEANRPQIESHDQDLKMQEEARQHEALLEGAKTLLRLREHHSHFETSSRALAQEFTLQLNEAELRVLSYNVAQANQEFYERVIDRKLGSIGTPQDTSVIGSASNEVKTINQLMTLFIKEKEREVKSNTLGKYHNFFGIFNEIIGDMPIDRFGRDEATQLMDGLYEYPSQRTRGTKASKSLAELKAEGAEPITPTTVGDAHNKLSSFFKWCVDMEYCSRNWLEGRGPVAKQKKSERRPWKQDELQTLFALDIFHGKSKKTWNYWLPIMGLATGARINELCSLRGCDIKEEDGVWVIDINDDGEKELKTDSSKRRVPIHNYLLTLGLHKFAASQGEGPLFPDLNKVAGRELGHGASKWFGRLKKDKLGLPEDVTFHSFRHLIRDMLTDAGAGGEVIASILGHAQTTTTFGKYGSSIRPSVLNRYIQKLPVEALLNGVDRWC